jgi:hypothetical protein
MIAEYSHGDPFDPFLAPTWPGPGRRLLDVGVASMIS